MVEVAGASQGNMLIHIYENGIAVTATLSTISGTFSTSYISLNFNETITVTAQACNPANPTQCSAEGTPVHLVPTNSFWDPQRSYWEGTPTTGPLAGQHLVYHFRDSGGIFATEDWVIPGVYGFWNTNLHLYVCDVIDPTPVSVTADGQEYTPDDIDGNWFTFSIYSAHYVSFTRGAVTNPGQVLIDPDGYIFDVTKGFDPANPTLHALKDVTVTCMVRMSEWGGWVPWPAYLYEGQQNPQITGEDGYFAFFTPPGQYYLQIDGKEGYQSWRSPVIEVINEIVHVNVPLTPLSDDNIQITLTTDGPSLSVIRIQPGQTVAWKADINIDIPLEQLRMWTENPISHVLSTLDPLADVLGFDSGLLTPGQSYSRQFNQPGVYTYTDGYGNIGTIFVGQGVYLPLIRK
jgi:plastocyanin